MSEYVAEDSATRVQALPRFDVLVRRRGDSRRFSVLESFPLDGPLRIGSDANNDVVLEGRDVEPRHAVVDITPRGPRLGLFGNAEASAGGALARGTIGILPGDGILIGGHRLTVELRDDERDHDSVWTVVTHDGQAALRVTRETTVGRAESCDLVLREVGVTPAHARLVPIGPFLWVQDDSGGQTFIDNTRVVGAALLHTDDRLRFGPEDVFAVLEGEAAAAAYMEAARATASAKPRGQQTPSRAIERPAVVISADRVEEAAPPPRAEADVVPGPTAAPPRTKASRRVSRIGLAVAATVVLGLAIAAIQDSWDRIVPWMQAELAASPAPDVTPSVQIATVASPEPVHASPAESIDASVAQLDTSPSKPTGAPAADPEPRPAVAKVAESAPTTPESAAPAPQTDAGAQWRDAANRIERALEGHRFADASQQLLMLEERGLSLERRSADVDPSVWNRLRVAQRLVRADALLQQRRIVGDSDENMLAYLTDALRIAPEDPIARDIGRKAEGYLLQQARHAEEDGKLDEFRRLSELAALVRESTRS